MRSAAVLLSTRRRAPRRAATREVQRARLRHPHRARPDAAQSATRPMRTATRRAPMRCVKRRERILHVIPRGFLPLVRH
jgi:hypothetical protein